MNNSDYRNQRFRSMAVVVVVVVGMNRETNALPTDDGRRELRIEPIYGPSGMAEDLLLRSYKEIVGEKKEQLHKQGCRLRSETGIRTYQLEFYGKRGTCGVISDQRSAPVQSLLQSQFSHTAMICSSFGLASSAVDSALRRVRSNFFISQTGP